LRRNFPYIFQQSRKVEFVDDATASGDAEDADRLPMLVGISHGATVSSEDLRLLLAILFWDHFNTSNLPRHHPSTATPPRHHLEDLLCLPIFS
jgi:hypothetical protein